LVKQIILLSDPIGTGKTTLCRNLESRFRAVSVKTKDLIRELATHIKPERRALQRYGQSLDRKTKGQWVRDALARRVTQLADDSIVIVDAVRIERQIEAIRQAYGPRVFHIHLHASDDVLASRYYDRKTDIKELSAYSDVKRNKTEREVTRLADIADVVIDTERCTEHDVLVRAASYLGLYGREYLRLVDVLVGLLSTSALLDAFEIDGAQRYQIESCHRPECVTISHVRLGIAVIRDQKPMSDAALRKCLQGMTPREWYETLNRRVFFWLNRGRLLRLLSARAYRNRRHCVLTLDTGRMLERHLERITLSPINSGCTVPNPQPRGPDTFLPVAYYPFEEWLKKRPRPQTVVELAVDYAVPDIADIIIRVEHMQGDRLLETLWPAE
jgi:adenylate kinase family enzyme